MTIKELLELHRTTCESGRAIMEAKNKDYTGGSDPFANFRSSEIYGVEPEIGILIRIGDKFKRVESFVKAGKLEVSNEAAEDSICDAINYLILLKGLIQERRERDGLDKHSELKQPGEVPVQSGDAAASNAIQGRKRVRVRRSTTKRRR